MANARLLMRTNFCVKPKVLCKDHLFEKTLISPLKELTHNGFSNHIFSLCSLKQYNKDHPIDSASPIQGMKNQLLNFTPVSFCLPATFTQSGLMKTRSLPSELEDRLS